MPSLALDRPLAVPRRYRDRTLEDFIPPSASAARALADARRFLGGDLRSLVLIGPPGVGKSHLAAAIVNALVARAIDARSADTDVDGLPPWEQVQRRSRTQPLPGWVNAAEMVVGLRADMDRTPDDRIWGRRVEIARHVPVLVLDDLGRERISDWTGELIYSLVNARYEAELATVATSNLSADELEANGYWPAISRLAEDGSLVQIDAPDHRMSRRET